ncbi:MAG: response regulator [Patescibacteria group bacterium]
MVTQKKILIAEDEDAVRTALVQALTAEGFRAVGMPDGQAAIDFALAEHPDLIVLDWLMPKMHGHDVYVRLRKDSWGNTVPVLILTNYSRDQMIEDALKHPKTELMVKNETKLLPFVEEIKKRLSA